MKNDFVSSLKRILGHSGGDVPDTGSEADASHVGIDPGTASPGSLVKTLRSRKILTAIFVAAGILAGAVVSGSFGQDGGEEKKPETANLETKPKAVQTELPKSYADIAKYNADRHRAQAADGAEKRALEQKPAEVQPVQQQVPPRPVLPEQPASDAANARSAAELAWERVVHSPIAFSLGGSVGTAGSAVAQGAEGDGVARYDVGIGGKGTHAASGSTDELDRYHRDYAQAFGGIAGDGMYTLQTGSVIQATLLTGISTDGGESQVVAQVRQNIYDSLTGLHLLVPQGTRIIGKTASMGNSRTRRVNISFERLIFPDGNSFDLPDADGIGGTGQKGLRDKYDDHASTLYRTAFWGAVVSALAGGVSSGSSSDDSSVGENARDSAAASILNTTNTLLQRDANATPTLEISPGFRFNVFVNSDTALPEYVVGK